MSSMLVWILDTNLNGCGCLLTYFKVNVQQVIVKGIRLQRRYKYYKMYKT